MLQSSLFIFINYETRISQPTLTTEAGKVAMVQVPLKWLLDNYNKPDAPKKFLMDMNSYAVSDVFDQMMFD